MTPLGISAFAERSQENNKASTKPLVSVIITSYNYGRYLEDAIISLHKQTYPNIEIIVVDDGSTDNTQEIAMRNSVKYLFEKNSGVSTAKNNGIQMSKGDFFICLDGDDKLLPSYVEKTIEKILGNSSIGFVYTGSIVWNESDNIENIWMPRRLLTKYSLFAGWHGALGPVLVKRKAFEELKTGFDPSFAVYEDMDLCFRILTSGWKCDFVFEPIHWYRIHPNSLNPVTSKQKKTAELCINRKYWFRPLYRQLCALYTNTFGRFGSLLKHPATYFWGLRKKIHNYISVKRNYSKNKKYNKAATLLNKEINTTVDLLTEFYSDNSLKNYYLKRIQKLESSLNRLLIS